jgi:hypothetical protein
MEPIKYIYKDCTIEDTLKATKAIGFVIQALLLLKLSELLIP